MGVTIKQIAEMAGVHRSTVDKVLHHREGVSDPVRKKVQKIIDECQYQANPIGKALKMQDKTIHIGVILLKVDALPYLRKGIEEELKTYESFQIELEIHEIAYSDVKKQAEILRKYKDEKKDGIILSPLNTKEIVFEIDQCTEAKIPVITINSDIKGSLRLCFIGQDGFKAGRVAGRLMGELLNGTGSVAIFTSDSGEGLSFPFGTREDGFKKVISDAFPHITLLDSISTQEDGTVIRHEMESLLAHKKDISGIFITCGGVKEVGEVLKRHDKKNVRLICYENYPEILQLMKEDIVTLTLDSGIEEQGRESINILMDYLIYDKKPHRKHCYTEINVMVKESI